MLKTGNLFAPVERSDEEFIEILMSGASRVERLASDINISDDKEEKAASTESLKIERIVSDGHISPPGFWYDQDECEFAAVLKGNAKLEFENYILELNAGDWVIIPAHERHRVIYTSSPCVWLTVFFSE